MKKALLLLMQILPIFLHLLLFTGCDSPSTQKTEGEWQLIAARDEGSSLDRPFLYRAFVPSHWVRKDPLPEESIQDSTKANCEFFIREENPIRITIHTFPIPENGPRIPPQAQIARWKQQLDQLDPLATLSADSYNGFSGLFFKGEGAIHGKPAAIIGVSMQLSPTYERLLSQENEPHSKLKRADYTIKATGAPEMVDKHSFALQTFFKSFEFIEELPYPL